MNKILQMNKKDILLSLAGFAIIMTFSAFVLTPAIESQVFLVQVQSDIKSTQECSVYRTPYLKKLQNHEDTKNFLEMVKSKNCKNKG